MRDQSRIRLWIHAIGFTAFLFIILSTVYMPFDGKGPIGWDEKGHLSYALQLRDQHFVPPQLGDLVFYDMATRLPTTEGNYINHPSTGYYPLALVLTIWPEASSTAVRLLYGLPGLLAYVIYLCIGRRAALPLAAETFYAWLPCILAFPAMISGLIALDASTMLGGTLIAFGLQRWHHNASHWLSIMLIGLVLTSIKLNSWLLAASFTGLYFLIVYPIRRLSLKQAAALLVTAGLCSLPYALLLLSWGSPAPDTPSQIHLLQTAGPLLNDSQQCHACDFMDYLAFALNSFTRYQNINALNPVYQLLYAALLIFMLRHAVLAVWDRKRSDPMQAILRATSLTWLLVFVIHIHYSYAHYRAYNWPLDFYSRYYAVLLPGLCLIVVDGLSRVKRYCFRK